jgi:hypothetical protein
MEFQLDSSRISTTSLTELYQMLETRAKQGSTQEIQITDLLAILNFPPDVTKKIREARGPVQVTGCSQLDAGKYHCQVSNSGGIVEEDIPGASSALGIIIEEQFSCAFTIDTQSKRIDITNISGLLADLPGPFNPSVDRISIVVPTREITIGI